MAQFSTESAVRLQTRVRTRAAMQRAEALREVQRNQETTPTSAGPTEGVNQGQLRSGLIMAGALEAEPSVALGCLKEDGILAEISSSWQVFREQELKPVLAAIDPHLRTA